MNETPTLQEYLDLMRKRDELSAEITDLELERVGLRASIEYLEKTQRKLRVSIAELCHELGNIFDTIGTMTYTEQTHKVLQPTKEDSDNFYF